MIYQLDNVGFKYPESANTLLAHFNLQINSHERWALIGPSGCGKTTLLYLLAGLKSPTEGSVLCQGKPAAAPMDRVSFIQQQYGLFRWKTVRKNLALPLLLKKTPRAEIQARVARELARLGLEGLEDKFPSQLSGGMRQRAALIRTLALEPSLLLLDEPFSALDYQTRLSVSDDIWKILQKEGKTALLVTHDISEAISMSDRVIILSKAPACVRCEIPILTTLADRAPMQMRNAPEFKQYFQQIWKELNHDA